jgi:uncharacterized protein
MTEIVQQIAKELAVRPEQVEATIRLLDEGLTVPFVARYRKEATQGLDDTQLRQLDTRLHYLRDLYERRAKVIESLREQEKLSDDLLTRVNAAETKKSMRLIVQNVPVNLLKQKKQVWASLQRRF